MALIMMCGLPSSGKTYRAKQILEDFQVRCGLGQVDGFPAPGLTSAPTHPSAPMDPMATSDKAKEGTTNSSDKTPQSNSDQLPPAAKDRTNFYKILYISDHNLQIARNAYGSSSMEKTARANISSAVKRALGRDRVVIVDSGNYIKGWRYQLHCEAKAMGIRSCVLHVGVTADKARGRNGERLGASHSMPDTKAEIQDSQSSSKQADSILGGSGEEDPYEERVWEELAARFEEPNGMARWDKPLFTIVWEDRRPPCTTIWEQIVRGVGKDGKVLDSVRPNQATILTPATPPNHLHILDRTTQTIISQIQSHQRANPDTPGGKLAVVASQQSPAIEVLLPDRLLSTAHLQRLRRQFETLQRQQMGGQGMGAVGRLKKDDKQSEDPSVKSRPAIEHANPDRIANLFINWLGDNFESNIH